MSLYQLAAKDTSPVLERVFDAFNEVTWVITAMGKPRSAQSPVIDEQVTRILIILLDMNVTIFQYIHTTGGEFRSGGKSDCTRLAKLIQKQGKLTNFRLLVRMLWTSVNL